MLLAAGMTHGDLHEACPPQLHPPSLQAREYLFFRLYGVQQVTPIVIMTSDAKGNHERVTEFMESCDWYGRGRKSFRLAPAGTLPCNAAFLCWEPCLQRSLIDTGLGLTPANKACGCFQPLESPSAGSDTPSGCLSCRIFRQPLVPVVSAEDGQWLLPEGVAPMLKPGGHGAIWKLMLDQGIFDWLSHHDREGAIVRQIRWEGWSMLGELFAHAAPPTPD